MTALIDMVYRTQRTEDENTGHFMTYGTEKVPDVADAEDMRLRALFICVDSAGAHGVDGPVTVKMWPRRTEEHYRTPPPADAMTFRFPGDHR